MQWTKIVYEDLEVDTWYVVAWPNHPNYFWGAALWTGKWELEGEHPFNDGREPLFCINEMDDLPQEDTLQPMFTLEEIHGFNS